jgi:hypothetical protein
MLMRACQKSVNANIRVQIRPINGGTVDFKMAPFLGRSQRKSWVKSYRDANESAVFQVKAKQFVIDVNFRNKRWRLHNHRSLTRVPPMFKPTLDDFCASRRENSTDLGNFLRFKAMIKRHCEVVHPNLAFVASLNHMHMDSLR